MASASRPSVRPRSAHRAAQSLTEDKIADELFKDVDESDIDDSDIDEDYTQPEEIETDRLPAQPSTAAWNNMATEEQIPSCSKSFSSSTLLAPTVAIPASAPGPRTPRRGAANGSRKAAGLFVWSDGEDFAPQIPDFDNRDVGITDLFPDTGDEMCKMDFFTAYFDEPLMEHVVHETNRLAADLIEDYWTKDNAVPTPLFGKYMSRDRFLLILRCIHFANNADETQDDRLWRVRHVLNDLIGDFRDYYVPAQKLVIDESLVLFIGRAAFKQYIPS
ncbi:piggyBac transposable element-derived protein 4-like [Procambarus clarkii]|uniref:piggyBac transposable element-derived protein 4-like n=1 Tax=Procambarus clarkii TaxID=6728 RepID=UPI0037426C64